MLAQEANEHLGIDSGIDSPRPEGMLHVAHDVVSKIASPARQALVLRFEQGIRVAGSEEGAAGAGPLAEPGVPVQALLISRSALQRRGGQRPREVGDPGVLTVTRAGRVPSAAGGVQR